MHSVVRGKILAELLDVAQFAQEIELGAHHLRELTDDGDWVVRLQVVDMTNRSIAAGSSRSLSGSAS